MSYCHKCGYKVENEKYCPNCGADLQNKNNSTSKHVLACLSLIVGYVLFGVVLSIDVFLLTYLIGLYYQLSAFLKLIIIIVGGTTVLGIAIAPLYYGIPLIHAWSEKICPSKKGLRYSILGLYVCFTALSNMLRGFDVIQIFLVIFGIAFILIGHTIRKSVN